MAQLLMVGAVKISTAFHLCNGRGVSRTKTQFQRMVIQAIVVRSVETHTKITLQKLQVIFMSQQQLKQDAEVLVIQFINVIVVVIILQQRLVIPILFGKLKMRLLVQLQVMKTENVQLVEMYRLEQLTNLSIVTAISLLQIRKQLVQLTVASPDIVSTVMQRLILQLLKLADTSMQRQLLILQLAQMMAW